MNVVAVTLLAVLAALAVLSYRRPAAGTIGLLVLIPLYYVLRGTGGQSAFVFLWPYLFMAALTHVLSLRGLAAASTPPGSLNHADRRVLAVLYAVLVLAIVVWSPFVIATFSQPVSVAIGQFNDYRLAVFALVTSALVAWPLVTALSRQPAWLRRLTVLDWLVAAFLLYGCFQLVVSLARTRHLFYSVESFRYYFLMAWTYFVVRFGLREERHARLAVATVTMAAVIVAGEFVVEHILFNSGVSSLQLPWLRAFDSLFAGYGRPVAVEQFVLMTPETETFILPYHGTRAIGLFIHPHTAGFFMTLGAVFVAAWIFGAKRRHWPWLLGALCILVYSVVLTMSRTAAILLYAVLTGVPLAVAWMTTRQFAVRRGLVYVVAVFTTVYVAANFSPGGELPHFRLGWYERPIVFMFRAAAGDLLAWNTPSMAALPGVVAASEAPSVSGHDTRTAWESSGSGLRALVSKLNPTVLLIGRGFSPLTRYVVDFFPEAAGNRHVSSTADVALLEFFQQFGAVGLGLLLSMFVAFAFFGVRDAYRWSGQPASIIALGVAFVVVVTAIGLLHLYPLFRTGVNTSIYALLGVFGFLHAERARS